MPEQHDDKTKLREEWGRWLLENDCNDNLDIRLRKALEILARWEKVTNA